MAPYMSAFSGIPTGAGLDMTAELAPILIGLMIVLSLCALGLIFTIWAEQFQAWAQKEAEREVVYRKHFFCPVRSREVEVDFLTPRGAPERLLKVMSCSACEKREENNCDKSCLHLPEAQQAQPRFPFSVFPFPVFP